MEVRPMWHWRGVVVRTVWPKGAIAFAVVKATATARVRTRVHANVVAQRGVQSVSESAITCLADERRWEAFEECASSFRLDLTACTRTESAQRTHAYVPTREGEKRNDS
jgi:hypothetical protein